MKSLHFKLFSRYAALIFALLIIFTTLFYTIVGNTLRTNATSELQADCDNISTLLDSQIDQMNQVSKRIVSSKQIQDLFIQDLYSYTPEAYNRKMAFSDALFDIIKLSFNNMELSIMDTSGRYVHVGNVLTCKKMSPYRFSLIPWFQPTLDGNGKKQIIPTDYPKSNSSAVPILSLCRSFSPEKTTDETAVLEIQMKYPFISQLIQDSIHNQKEAKQIFVYDTDGKPIYPFDAAPSAETSSYIQTVLCDSNRTGKPTVLRMTENSPKLFAYKESPYTGLIVFVEAEEATLFASFYRFRTIIFGTAFGALLVTLFLTYQISNRLVTPLRELEKTARSLTLDNLDSSELSNYQSSFQEVDSLHHSFELMKNNLQKSLQEVVAAHTVAVDAKLLALQSQMNPHFLYNTLASISILAEDGEDEKVVETCNDLSLMLRYISSNSSMNVQFWQEIEHTRSYINLIKIKYEERIQFHLDMEESLLSISIPKLIIQPLVENCIKYALNVTPPWEISIRGLVRENFWMVEIKDNGPGFSQEYLDLFYEKIQAYSPENPLPDLSINGMGILNLYTRLFLLYKEDVVFQLKNNPDRGACVTIGGPLPKDIGENTYEKPNI